MAVIVRGKDEYTEKSAAEYRLYHQNNLAQVKAGSCAFKTSNNLGAVTR